MGGIQKAVGAERDCSRCAAFVSECELCASTSPRSRWLLPKRFHHVIHLIPVPNSYPDPYTRSSLLRSFPRGGKGLGHASPPFGPNAGWPGVTTRPLAPFSIPGHSGACLLLLQPLRGRGLLFRYAVSYVRRASRGALRVPGYSDRKTERVEDSARQSKEKI